MNTRSVEWEILWRKIEVLESRDDVVEERKREEIIKRCNECQKESDPNEREKKWKKLLHAIQEDAQTKGEKKRNRGYEFHLNDINEYWITSVEEWWNHNDQIKELLEISEGLNPRDIEDRERKVLELFESWMRKIAKKCEEMHLDQIKRHLNEYHMRWEDYLSKIGKKKSWDDWVKAWIPSMEESYPRFKKRLTDEYKWDERSCEQWMGFDRWWGYANSHNRLLTFLDPTWEKKIEMLKSDSANIVRDRSPLESMETNCVLRKEMPYEYWEDRMENVRNKGQENLGLKDWVMWDDAKDCWRNEPIVRQGLKSLMRKNDSKDECLIEWGIGLCWGVMISRLDGRIIENELKDFKELLSEVGWSPNLRVIIPRERLSLEQKEIGWIQIDVKTAMWVSGVSSEWYQVFDRLPDLDKMQQECWSQELNEEEKNDLKRSITWILEHESKNHLKEDFWNSIVGWEWGFDIKSWLLQSSEKIGDWSREYEQLMRWGQRIREKDELAWARGIIRIRQDFEEFREETMSWQGGRIRERIKNWEGLMGEWESLYLEYHLKCYGREVENEASERWKPKRI